MSTLRDELAAIRNENEGRLTPLLVLEVARDEDHPLHSRFEWDDGIAAEKYRLDQAQRLIMSVKWRYDPDDPTKETRRYYAIRAADSDEYTYDDVEEIMQDDFRRKLLLNEMQRRIDELVGQFGALEEFWRYLRGIKRKKWESG